MATLDDDGVLTPSVRGGGTIIPFVIASVIALAFVVFDLGLSPSPKGLTGEGGPIETASALLWIYAAAALVWFAPRTVLGQGWQFPALFVLFAARELDMDKAYLSEGILKARLYSGDAPIGEKLIGLIVIALILTIAIRLFRRNLGDWLRGLGRAAPWALTAGGALALAFVSKTIDGAGRKLEPLGIQLSDAVIAATGATEEWMELAFVLLAVLAVCLWARSKLAPQQPSEN
ncbi:MAG: hypothetical protein AAGA05_03955 [Pseudomonadota bacterium]